MSTQIAETIQNKRAQDVIAKIFLTLKAVPGRKLSLNGGTDNNMVAALAMLSPETIKDAIVYLTGSGIGTLDAQKNYVVPENLQEYAESRRGQIMSDKLRTYSVYSHKNDYGENRLTLVEDSPFRHSGYRQPNAAEAQAIMSSPQQQSDIFTDNTLKPKATSLSGLTLTEMQAVMNISPVLKEAILIEPLSFPDGTIGSVIKSCVADRNDYISEAVSEAVSMHNFPYGNTLAKTPSSPVMGR